MLTLMESGIPLSVSMQSTYSTRRFKQHSQRGVMFLHFTLPGRETCGSQATAGDVMGTALQWPKEQVWQRGTGREDHVCVGGGWQSLDGRKKCEAEAGGISPSSFASLDAFMIFCLRAS